MPRSRVREPQPGQAPLPIRRVVADDHFGRVMELLDRTGRLADTMIVFTSDHGDMCGSHGLRSKGPFVYNEIMKVPLYVRVPGVTAAGSVTSSLGSRFVRNAVKFRAYTWLA